MGRARDSARIFKAAYERVGLVREAEKRIHLRVAGDGYQVPVLLCRLRKRRATA